jgi:type III secretion system YseE family protein
MSETAQTLDPTELMERLMVDNEGSVRAAAIARLEEKSKEIKRALDAGVSPDQYQVLTKTQEALQAAPLVINKAWEGFRKIHAK